MMPESPRVIPPEIDVIIVTYNAARYIEACLESLLARNRRYSYRITVVDNASTDGTPDLITTKFPSVKLRRSVENLGFACANNLAAADSQGEYVVFLNPDTEVKEGALDRLIDFLEAHPDAGAVGPKLLNGDGSPQLTGNTFPSLRNLFFETLFLDRLFPRSRIFGDHKLSWWNRQEASPVDWVMGACLAVRREVGVKLGWFDTRFYMYFEETDLYRRIWDAGYKVYYVPQAEVIHFGGIGPKAYSGQKVLWWHQSLFYYFRKHHPGKLILLRPLIFFRSLLRSGLWLLLTVRYGGFAWEKARGYLKTFPLVWSKGWCSG
ncbi:glycosyltransferase [Desulfofundulus thermobenzoicus]|uniref:Glycosyltransferase n=2 Tax=Desulfofundulus thermobenzoicus TaxID=29376 RepID=A0A6N7IS03_9FIRM|nr:glycosyltransferase [Desulfofundulus thermobenzoicus]